MTLRVLLIEDDESLGANTQEGLRLKGHIVDWVKDGQMANQVLKHSVFDVIILDLSLPKVSGYQVLQNVRSRGLNTPVLILTAHDDVENCVRGLNLGADDYMTKPFDFNELDARLSALQRRSLARAETIIRYRNIALDPTAHTVTVNQKPIDLTRREFILLQKLLENPGKVLSRDYLMQMIYGWNENADSNTLEVFMHHLRKKVEPAKIRTIRGIGYMVDKT